MLKFIESLDQETRDAGEQFIRRINAGILQKKILPNSAEEYSLDEASRSFDALLHSDEFEGLLGRKKHA